MKRKRQNWNGIGIAGLGILLTGCNDRDAKNLTEDTRKLAQTSGVALANATLAGKVNGVLSIWKGVDMSGFKVSAEDGTLTLDGTVRNVEEKTRILNVVRNIRGVDKIVNKLTVK